MKIYYLFFLIIIKQSNCWDLSSLNVNNDYYVNSVAVHRSRAFLALPRSACPNNESDPTLIEVHWNGDGFNHFPNNRPKIVSSQNWNDCESIQDAISLEMEPVKPKLWILDKGNDKCLPKVLSYSLVFNNIAESTELTKIDGRNLNILVIDPFLEDELGHRAYIGNVEENVLLIFSLRKLIWWKIYLSEPSIFSIPIRTDFLAISKVSPELFITGKDQLDVFSLNLEPIRQMEEPLAYEVEDILFIYNATNRGEKLATSTGIVTDSDSGLTYFMKKDYAIVRWDTRLPLQAEYHQVLFQSYQNFPYISGFLADSQDSIWALVNPLSPLECDNTDIPTLDARAVRILKYNIFTKEIEPEQIDTELQSSDNSGLEIIKEQESDIQSDIENKEFKEDDNGVDENVESEAITKEKESEGEKEEEQIREILEKSNESVLEKVMQLDQMTESELEKAFLNSDLESDLAQNVNKKAKHIKKYNEEVKEKHKEILEDKKLEEYDRKIDEEDKPVTEEDEEIEEEEEASISEIGELDSEKEEEETSISEIGELDSEKEQELTKPKQASDSNLEINAVTDMGNNTENENEQEEEFDEKEVTSNQTIETVHLKKESEHIPNKNLMNHLETEIKKDTLPENIEDYYDDDEEEKEQIGKEEDRIIEQEMETPIGKITESDFVQQESNLETTYESKTEPDLNEQTESEEKDEVEKQKDSNTESMVHESELEEDEDYGQSFESLAHPDLVDYSESDSE